MTFESGLAQGQVIDNLQLCQTFGCSPQGGMRRSRKTKTLVLGSAKFSLPFTRFL